MSLQYQDDYYGDNNRDGNSTDLIDQRRKTQAEKDAAKGKFKDQSLKKFEIIAENYSKFSKS